MVGFRRWLRILIPIQTNPKRIALGVSLGVLISFSPTIGFQIGLALVAASIFNASRVAAVTCVWITNPLTMGPIYAFTYMVGRPFWSASPDVGLSQLSQTISGGQHWSSIGAVFTAFRSIYSLGPGMFMPMLIGGLITGGVAGALCYLPAKSIASYGRKTMRRSSRPSRRGSILTTRSPLTRHRVETVKVLRSDGKRTSSRRRAA